MTLTSNDIKSLAQRVIDGDNISPDEALALAYTTETEALYDAAMTITAKMVPRHFDSCSIVNVRSGLCPENCKWCAQSRQSDTGIETYPMLEQEKVLEHARAAAINDIGRFSLVASGRSVKGNALKEMCDTIRRIGNEVKINLCASMGLLDREDLQQLWNAGVRRYHCNLETAPSFFPELCTTHTIDDKLRTIKWAKEIGFEICSGGIIGMGETMEQRIEFAFKLKEVQPCSIPINILCPIPGTPLENATPLSDDEVLRTVAVFRFIHPKIQLRFAGGRARLPHDVQIKAMRLGINGGIVGDLLTTIGSTVNDDKERVKEAGYDF